MPVINSIAVYEGDLTEWRGQLLQQSGGGQHRQEAAVQLEVYLGAAGDVVHKDAYLVSIVRRFGKSLKAIATPQEDDIAAGQIASFFVGSTERTLPLENS